MYLGCVGSNFNRLLGNRLLAAYCIHGQIVLTILLISNDAWLRKAQGFPKQKYDPQAKFPNTSKLYTSLLFETLNPFPAVGL